MVFSLSKEMDMGRIAALCALLAVVAGCLVPRPKGPRSLGIVYHSDTKGFYKPCG